MKTGFRQTLSKAVLDRLPTNQDKNIVSLFHPERLMELTKYFVLFDKNVKKIARYQQYFAKLRKLQESERKR